MGVPTSGSPRERRENMMAAGRSICDPPPRRRCRLSALPRRRRQSPRLLDVQGCVLLLPPPPAAAAGAGELRKGWSLRSGGFAVLCDKCGLEDVVGWYHSHPGYRCCLSGIHVSTQMLNQQFTELFLAVVIDPTRTVSAGKVDIGAFRTYPKDYKPPDEHVSEYQPISLNKTEYFGVHCKQVLLLFFYCWQCKGYFVDLNIQERFYMQQANEMVGVESRNRGSPR